MDDGVRKLGAPLSIAGLALFIGGALAWLLESEDSTSWLALANALTGIAAVAIAAFLKPEMFKQYGRWINAAWGGIMVLAIVVMVNSQQAAADTPLHDGDVVELVTQMVGGTRT